MLDYQNDVLPIEADHSTDDAIAAAIAAARLTDPASYRPITPSQVASWLAEAGTEARLRAWHDAAAPTSAELATIASDPDVATRFALWSGVAGLLRLADLPTGRDFDVSPGTDARSLVDAAVALPSIPATDADRTRLIARALREPLPTAADVATARDRWNAAALERRFSAAVKAGRDALDAGGDVAAVKLAVDAAWGA